MTQLPVPSRLGMLRFERLNEPSWAMLYIDPACQASLGVPATDLCALVDAAYATLMAPQSRYSLHDDIQQQLLSHSYYSVTYVLHTPTGPITLIEIGEPYKQRTRQLLRGYLMVHQAAALPRAVTVDLDQYRRTEADHLAHLARSRTQQDLIVRLARQRYVSADPQREAAELITQAACELYGTARASLWTLNEQMLEPVTLYRSASAQHELPLPVDTKQFPLYLEALRSGRAIAADNALDDPRTRELAASYLVPEGINSILDASVRVDGEVVGILCLEHIGPLRQWRADEIAFAGELADQYAQVIINQQRRNATHALQLFKRAVEQSASAFVLVNHDGVVEYVNPSFTTITQYSGDEVCGQRLSDLPALANLEELLFDTHSHLSQHSSWQGEFRSRRKNQEPYWGHLSLSKVYSDTGVLTHYIGIYEDVTESKRVQQRIERLAYTDNLTGLGNRPAFIRALEERFARPDNTPIWLLLVDVDNFKRINDSLGHKTGDKLLSALARRLRNSLSGYGTLARFASNEFAVMLHDGDANAGLRMAERILDTLDKPLFVDNQLINVTGSVGLALSPDHGSDPQTLLKHAGLALHKAKASGKHQVQLFTEALNAEAHYKLFVENNLRRALTQNELDVAYQPKLCLKTGRLLGMEALLRWHHPERGLIRPDQFISVAEETGLIIPIGKWVLRQVCRMSKQLYAIGLGRVQMAINLSPKQFSDPDLVGSITSILNEEKLCPSALELELTESLLLEASDNTHQQLNRLKSLGLTLAMDDFGTGYSSLSYLKKFPIDVIKIDRSFIKDIPQDTDDMEITSAVIAMAHNLKLEVVAEGIETREQLAFLRRNNCDIGQGYLFDQPIASRELIERLRRYPCRRAR